MATDCNADARAKTGLTLPHHQIDNRGWIDWGWNCQNPNLISTQTNINQSLQSSRKSGQCSEFGANGQFAPNLLRILGLSPKKSGHLVKMSLICTIWVLFVPILPRFSQDFTNIQSLMISWLCQINNNVHFVPILPRFCSILPRFAPI